MSNAPLNAIRPGPPLLFPTGLLSKPDDETQCGVCHGYRPLSPILDEDFGNKLSEKAAQSAEKAVQSAEKATKSARDLMNVTKAINNGTLETCHIVELLDKFLSKRQSDPAFKLDQAILDASSEFHQTLVTLKDASLKMKDACLNIGIAFEARLNTSTAASNHVVEEKGSKELSRLLMKKHWYPTMSRVDQLAVLRCCYDLSMAWHLTRASLSHPPTSAPEKNLTNNLITWLRVRTEPSQS